MFSLIRPNDLIKPRTSDVEEAFRLIASNLNKFQQTDRCIFVDVILPPSKRNEKKG